LGFVLLLSVSMVMLPFVLIMWAQRHTSSVTITVLFAAMPLLVGLLKPDDMPRGAMQATVVGLGGIVLVMGPGFSVSQAAGAAVALLAVAITGASAVLARRELRAVNPLAATAVLSGVAGLLLFLASMAFERGQPAQWNRSAVTAVIFLGLVAGAPAYALYFWLLQQLEAYKVTTVQWIEPLVALVETAIFLRFGLSLSMIAGSIVTMTSLLLVMHAGAEDDQNVSLLGNWWSE
jgi:drug/metabolite transporter (DMT)-like permease